VYNVVVNKKRRVRVFHLLMSFLLTQRGDWKRGTGKRGTRLQGWKTRE